MHRPTSVGCLKAPGCSLQLQRFLQGRDEVAAGQGVLKGQGPDSLTGQDAEAQRRGLPTSIHGKVPWPNLQRIKDDMMRLQLVKALVLPRYKFYNSVGETLLTNGDVSVSNLGPERKISEE